MNLAPVTSSSTVRAVTAVSAQFGAAMAANEFYLFMSSTNCYISQGLNPTAAAADGNTFVPAGTLVPIYGGHGAVLAVIRATADGTASLTRARAG